MGPVALAMLFGNLGTTEILLIVLVLVLLFGARRIPELARGLGRGVQEFKSGMRTSPPADDSAAQKNAAKDEGQDRPGTKP